MKKHAMSVLTTNRKGTCFGTHFVTILVRSPSRVRGARCGYTRQKRSTTAVAIVIATVVAAAVAAATFTDGFTHDFIKPETVVSTLLASLPAETVVTAATVVTTTTVVEATTFLAAEATLLAPATANFFADFVTTGFRTTWTAVVSTPGIITIRGGITRTTVVSLAVRRGIAFRWLGWFGVVIR